MDASRYAGLEDRGDALEEGVQPREKAKRISSAGDVAALTALAFGGLVGVVLLPVIIAARCVHGCYKLGKRKLAKSDPEQQVQDCDGIWPYINVHDDGGLHRLPDGTMRLAGYVKMSDGVRIAIDVLLPRQAQGADGSVRPVPCVLHMARYWRAWEMRWPFRELVNGGQPWDFLLGPWKSALLTSGFAVVSADVRGAGASSGTQSVVWSPRETQDTLAFWQSRSVSAHELIDFIVGGSHAVTTQRARQPWSDGQVALFGVSYDAGAAVRAAAHQHPAVKALVASFLFGDIWRELFPGGIMNRWFLQSWCDVNSRLDNCRLSAIHPFAPLAMKGAAPASSKQQLARHVAEHSANWDLMSAAGSVAAIDDPVSISSGETMTCQNLELFSDPLPSLEGKAVLPSVAASQLPVLIISGWSCVTSGTACATFSALAGKHWRLLVGPWNHGGVQHVRYCRDTKLLKFPKAHAVQDFLLHHMQPKSQTPEWLASPQPEAHFYLCGAAPAWQHSTKWPPEGVVKKPLWLSGSKTLSWTESELESEGASQLPKATGAKQVVWGGVSRYMAMIKMMDLVKYKWNQSSIAKGRALLFESAPSNEPLAVIGSPVLSLRLKSSRDQDADVFAYLCERPPNGGDLVYVTEGMLRLSYRKEEDAPSHEKAADPPSEAGVVPHHSYRRRDMEMLPPEGEFTTARLKFFPVAYRFRAGSRVALVICPDDATHYVSNPLAGQHPPFICHSKSEQSLLWLPIQQGMTAAGTAL